MTPSLPSQADLAVAVVGDLMVDIVVTPSEPLVTGSDAAAKIVTRPGGSGANVAAWLKETGVNVAMVGVVGCDDVGAAQVTALSARGVATMVRPCPSRATGTAVAIIDSANERTFLTDRGANEMLEARDIPTHMPGHLHVSGYSIIGPGSTEAACHALRAALESGSTTSVDASSTGPLARLGSQAWFELTRDVTICFANFDEGAALTGYSEPLEIARSLSRRYLHAVLKAGALGSWWASGEEDFHVPAVDVEAVVNTVGAGDAFAAGYLAQWLRNGDCRAALEEGSRIAARALAMPGGRLEPASSTPKPA